MSPYGRFYISLDSSLRQIKDCDGSPLTTLKIESVALIFFLIAPGLRSDRLKFQ
jgi:hypothetical protein